MSFFIFVIKHNFFALIYQVGMYLRLLDFVCMNQTQHENSRGIVLLTQNKAISESFEVETLSVRYEGE